MDIFRNDVPPPAYAQLPRGDESLFSPVTPPMYIDATPNPVWHAIYVPGEGPSTHSSLGYSAHHLLDEAVLRVGDVFAESDGRGYAPLLNLSCDPSFKSLLKKKVDHFRHKLDFTLVTGTKSPRHFGRKRNHGCASRTSYCAKNVILSEM